MYNFKNKKIKRKIAFSLVTVFGLLFIFLFNINNNFKVVKSEVNGLLSVFEMNDSIAYLKDELAAMESSDLNIRVKSDYFRHRDLFLEKLEYLESLDDLLTKGNLRSLRQIELKTTDLTDTKNKILTAFQYDNEKNLVEHNEQFKREIVDIDVGLRSIIRDVYDLNDDRVENVGSMIDDGIKNVVLLIILVIFSVIIFIYFVKSTIERDVATLWDQERENKSLWGVMKWW